METPERTAVATTMRKEWLDSDYYALLGVDKDASEKKLEPRFIGIFLDSAVAGQFGACHLDPLESNPLGHPGFIFSVAGKAVASMFGRSFPDQRRRWRRLLGPLR